jgi:hypothetical protein
MSLAAGPPQIQAQRFTQAWWMYPIDAKGSSYGQITDPLGTYLKPDVNIAVPAGVPITSLTNGVVTDVSDHGSTGGGLSVVILMMPPLNTLATHVAYNYLGSAAVRVGQTVAMGQQIGVAGSKYGILLAVGLTPDNVWGGPSFYLNAQGNKMLDPHQLLTGSTNFNGVNINLNTGATSVFGPYFQSVSNATHDFLNNIPGFAGLCYGLDAVEQFVPFKLVNSGGQDVGILGKIPIFGYFITGEANIATLPADAIQALLTFITANLMAALVRLFIIAVGLIILITLIHNALEYASTTDTGRAAGTIASFGQMIAATA